MSPNRPREDRTGPLLGCYGVEYTTLRLRSWLTLNSAPGESLDSIEFYGLSEIASRQVFSVDIFVVLCVREFHTQSNVRVVVYNVVGFQGGLTIVCRIFVSVSFARLGKSAHLPLWNVSGVIRYMYASPVRSLAYSICVFRAHRF